MFTQWLSNKSRILIKDFIPIVLCAFKGLFEWIINKKEQFILDVSKLHFISHRSSQRRSSLKKGVLKKFAICTEKRLCWSLFSVNLQGWLIVSKMVCGIFLTFCRSSFINNFVRKNNFLEPKYHRKLNISGPI